MSKKLWSGVDELGCCRFDVGEPRAQPCVHVGQLREVKHTGLDPREGGDLVDLVNGPSHEPQRQSLHHKHLNLVMQCGMVMTKRI